MTQITGGSTRFMRRVQVAQYEPKEAEVTLTFAVSEGQDHSGIVMQAGQQAVGYVEQMLKGTFTTPESAPVEHKPATKKTDKKPEPVKEAVTDPTAIVEDAVTAETISEQVADKDPAAVEEVTKAREVPDKELADACAAASKKTENTDGIRAVIAKYIAPPGRVSGIPQDKRLQFLEDLKGVKKIDG